MTRDYETDLARNILSELQGHLISVWDDLPEADRQLLARVARMVAKIQLDRLTGGEQYNDGDWRHCLAQVAGIRAFGAARGRRALIAAARRGVDLFLELLK
jgi:hypothetical protein